jgi:hypothetical protein
MKARRLRLLRPLALPGTYTLTLTVDGKGYTQTVNVKNDPALARDEPTTCAHSTTCR